MMSNYTVGSITYSPNYSIQPPQRVAAKTVEEEELEHIRRELRQLRRVASAAATVVAWNNSGYLDVGVAIRKLAVTLDYYTQDKE